MIFSGVGQVVKTSAFHAGITGSIPVRRINLFLKGLKMSSNNYQLLLSDLLKSLEEKGIDITKLNVIEEKDIEEIN